MDIREECLKAIALGIPKAAFAKMIGRDSSTIYKWLDGTRKLSPIVEQEVAAKLLDLKEQWQHIMEEDE